MRGKLEGKKVDKTVAEGISHNYFLKCTVTLGLPSYIFSCWSVLDGLSGPVTYLIGT
jgi:hypothetical protein